MANKLAYEIWGNLKDNAVERAENFKVIIEKIIQRKICGEYYLDIGGGLGINAAVIGRDFKATYSLDLYIPSDKCPNVNYVIGDAHHLKYDDSYFDLVSLFSVIEHVKKPDIVLNEAVRVLKKDGLLVIQFPNWHFPIDLHTGLINPFFMPKAVRAKLMKKINFQKWLEEVYYIRPKTIIKILFGKCQLIGKENVIYPSSLVPFRYSR